MPSFDEIKKEIQQLSLSSLVNLCLVTLNNSVDTPRLKIAFWEILVLIKWAYLHTDDSPGKRNATQSDLAKTLNLIRDFGNDHSDAELNNEQNIQRYFKIMGYQQFALQEEHYNAIIDRQIVLYNQIKTKSRAADIFYNQTGLSIETFFGYCQLTYFFLFTTLLIRMFPELPGLT